MHTAEGPDGKRHAIETRWPNGTHRHNKRAIWNAWLCFVWEKNKKKKTRNQASHFSNKNLTWTPRQKPSALPAFLFDIWVSRSPTSSAENPTRPRCANLCACLRGTCLTDYQHLSTILMWDNHWVCQRSIVIVGKNIRNSSETKVWLLSFPNFLTVLISKIINVCLI